MLVPGRRLKVNLIMAARKIGKLLLIIVWSIIFTTNVFMSKHSTSHSCARFLLHSPICFEVWEECYVTVCGHSFWYAQVLVKFLLSNLGHGRRRWLPA